jgi:hypothetical protein
MEVQVEPTREDLCAFNMFYLQYSKEARKQLRRARIARIVLLMIFAAFLVFGMRSAGLLVSWSSSFLAFALIAALYTAQIVLTESRQLKRRVQRLTDEGNQRAALSPRTYRLTEDAVTYDGELTGGWTKWEAVEDVQETEEHIFIILSMRVAYIIPKRAFTTPVDAQQFAETARRFKSDSGPMGRGAAMYVKNPSDTGEVGKAPVPSMSPATSTPAANEATGKQDKDAEAFDVWS